MSRTGTTAESCSCPAAGTSCTTNTAIQTARRCCSATAGRARARWRSSPMPRRGISGCGSSRPIGRGLATRRSRRRRKLVDWPAGRGGADGTSRDSASFVCSASRAARRMPMRRLGDAGTGARRSRSSSGAPPIAELPDHSGLLTLYRWMLAFYGRGIRSCAARLFTVARPFAMVRPSPRLRPMFLKLLQPCDAEVAARCGGVRCVFRKRAARVAWLGGGRDDGCGDLRAAMGLSVWKMCACRCSSGTGQKTARSPYRLAEEIATRLPNARAAAGRERRPLLAADSPHARHSARPRRPRNCCG